MTVGFACGGVQSYALLDCGSVLFCGEERAACVWFQVPVLRPRGVVPIEQEELVAYGFRGENGRLRRCDGVRVGFLLTQEPG